MDFYSPLRYPGGKGKVASYFKQLYKDNLLYGSTYVEPYAGGASVGLSLLFGEYAPKIIINDIDRSIYAFWYSIIKNSEQLCKLIFDTPVNRKHWKIQKEVQRNKMHESLLELGFSTFYLNRTNRSGILNAGIIGGTDQSGEWKIDARFNKKDLISRIERIALYGDKIKVYNLDAVQLIKKLKPTLNDGSFFFFDPPYFLKGQDLYINFYKPQDHQVIAKEISKIKNHKWVVTYDNVPEIKSLYQNFNQTTFSLNYSAEKKMKGQEVMIFSDNLYIPPQPIIAPSARK